MDEIFGKNNTVDVRMFSYQAPNLTINTDNFTGIALVGLDFIVN